MWWLKANSIHYVAGLVASIIFWAEVCDEELVEPGMKMFIGLLSFPVVVALLACVVSKVALKVEGWARAAEAERQPNMERAIAKKVDLCASLPFFSI